MPSLKTLRKRIATVRSTQQITRAMKMVAGARLNRAQQRIVALRPYAIKTAEILQDEELNVNSSHHQAIGRVADGLRVTAHAPDGVIEGLEDPAHPFYVGVQWHPEDMPGEESASVLFQAFVEAARKYRNSRFLTAV